MSQHEIPDRMTAVLLDSYSGVEALRVEERPVPRPGKNEVLVKVAAAPINPSDLAFLEGRYGFKKPLPVVPGFEGSGIVVRAGSSMIGKYLMAKRVACVCQDKGDGPWAEYMVTATKYALPLDKSIGLEQGATSLVNPLTAFAFLTIAKKEGHTVIINTAAASVLGQMVNHLALNEGIQVINVVRRDSQGELLKRRGVQIVLNSSEPNFGRQLHDVCHQHKACLAFDAVGGPMTMQLLDAMPSHSKVTLYGLLSPEPAQAQAVQLIFQHKTVDGFWLASWLAERNILQNAMLWRRAQKMLAKEFKSEILTKYPLQDAKEAVRDYQSQMTGGKILFVPQ